MPGMSTETARRVAALRKRHPAICPWGDHPFDALAGQVYCCPSHNQMHRAWRKRGSAEPPRAGKRGRPRKATTL